MLALAAIVAAALPMSPACHPNWGSRVRAQLDADRRAEIVEAYDAHNCAHTSWIADVHVQDRCRGSRRTISVVHDHARLRAFRVADVDRWTRRQEIFYATTSGAQVVRLAGGPGTCPSPVALYTYRPSPAPDGFTPVGPLVAELGNFTGRFRGLEVKVSEAFAPAGTTSATERLVTLYRYDRFRRRYVPYSATTSTV